MTDPIGNLAKAAGILPAYRDLSGNWHNTSRETNLALLSAMGFKVSKEAQAAELLDHMENSEDQANSDSWQVVAAGEVPDIPIEQSAQFVISFEDGKEFEGRGSQDLPAMPLGRHRLVLGKRTMTILSAPPSLPSPSRGWGVVLPLAGLRDARQGGIGNYKDLEIATAALGERGASFVGINPVHAGFPEDQSEISPYSPSHRRRMNVMHVAIDDVAPVHIHQDPLINFEKLIPEKRKNLRHAFNRFEENSDTNEFNRFVANEGAALRLFALHQALSSVHGPYWNNWPTPLKNPQSPQCRQALQDLAGEIRFHCWLQWMAETQLASVHDTMKKMGMSQGLYLDIAVGTHPWGAETWMDKCIFANGAWLGAPPDAFANEGQNWMLAPFNPHALARDGFGALAETIRKQLQFAGLLRIDHILGFERAF
ncbi:MAG: 4-alpha-glucanotransferase, partial [Rhizobiaceae bacterium]